jgi:hypothetical protein
MARVVKLVSDITGTEAPEEDFIVLVIREHPAVDQPKQLDVLPSEVADLKSVKDLVVVEIKNNGESREVVMSYPEFKKLVPDDVVVKAAGTRGRRVGFSPKN